MPSSQPRWDSQVRLSLASLRTLAFPGCPAGRLPRLRFSRSRRSFTCVTAWAFAESPSDPLSRRLRQVRFLPCRFNSYWASDPSQAGLAPAETNTSSRRTDIQFFELAYLEVEIKTPKKLTAAVKLRDFVIPNTELIPEDVRSKVKKWSDYIDYWAVDWDFQNDTFMQGWVTYRTRQDRSLALESEPHTYAKAGKYRVLVKVIDIFGNDTSQAFDVEVK